MTNAYYFYHNGKSCITNELQALSSSDPSVTSLLRDGTPYSCLAPASLITVNLRVVVPMSLRSSQLLNIWVLGHIQDCSPGGGLTMFVVNKYGEADSQTSSCVTRVSVRPGLCPFRCQTKRTEYIVLNVLPRDDRTAFRICEIYIAWGITVPWYGGT